MLPVQYIKTTDEIPKPVPMAAALITEPWTDAALMTRLGEALLSVYICLQHCKCFECNENRISIGPDWIRCCDTAFYFWSVLMQNIPNTRHIV